MSFIPHGYCLDWDPILVWVFVLSNVTIAFSYYTMPAALFYLARQRRDLPFRTIFMLTAVFVLCCGTGHAMSVVDLWFPHYWISGSIKMATAIASIGTTATVWQSMPQILTWLPGPKIEPPQNGYRSEYARNVAERIEELTIERAGASRTSTRAHAPDAVPPQVPPASKPSRSPGRNNRASRLKHRTA